MDEVVEGLLSFVPPNAFDTSDSLSEIAVLAHDEAKTSKTTSIFTKPETNKLSLT